MEKRIIELYRRKFDDIRHEADGIEYWYARELMKLLEYVQWRNFDNAINKAMISCENNGNVAEDHFSRINNDEGLCVQCMHIGSYDHEPATVDAMHRFMEEQGYVLDITDQRMHHEIYLSDARRVAPEKLKTVVRHPIKTMEE